MSKFIIECPKCHRYANAATGFFASKKVHCVCGNVIQVKTDRITTRTCPGCGNNVAYDQAQGDDAVCLVCKTKINTPEMRAKTATINCVSCGCSIQVRKEDSQIVCPICDTRNEIQQALKLQQERESGIPAVIQYEGDNSVFVWKHPVTDFVTGSQLIVHESQEAIFLRNGEALDSFGPGRYTLETGMLPKMGQYFALPMNGHPFPAEVYFINLAVHMGIKWGTNSKVGLFDPATGMHVELGASGSFNLQVTDARRLLIRLVGTTDGLSREQVFGQNGSGYFRTLVMTKVKAMLAKIIKANHINVLELDEHIDVISTGLRDAINADLADYGLTMPEFYVANILTPDDDPNFRRMKQQHAEMYLNVRQEEIRKAEAEAAYERKAVEAQTAARMKVISAQGDADVTRITAQAEADAYRMKAEAEAQEMRMKGYTYQQETSRQLGLEAVRSLGESGGNMAGGTLNGVMGMAGDMMQLGVGLGAVGSVIGMTKDAITPVINATGNMMQQAAATGWNCSCGESNIQSKFCPNCGSKRPEPESGWKCPSCGKAGITSRFCPECGAKKPEAPAVWTCPDCGTNGIRSKFCPECGHKKED